MRAPIPMLGVVALGGIRFLPGAGTHVPPSPLLPLQQAVWTRASGPILTPMGGGGFDGTNIFMPVIARNLDRSVYRDNDSKMYQYYIATNVEDRSGLALGSNVDNWTRYSSSPVLDIGVDGDPDWGDAQITSVWWDHVEEEFVCYYQGNANGSGSGGDEITVCLALSPNGKNWTKQGIVLDRGPVGDALDLYVPRLVPAGHDGLPRLYYTGQDGSSVRGLMCAVSLSGDIRGPWTRLRDYHLFRDTSTFLGDIWYDGERYHALYSPLDTVRAIIYATSEDGESFAVRGELVPRNIGQWDTNPFNGGFYEIDGTWYIFFNSSSSIGNGYHYAAPV